MYKPSEDSYLLASCLKECLKNKDKNIKILDMGSGSGILAETCKNLGFNNILTADIDKEAISFLKKKGFEAIKSDLFSNLKKDKFSLIVFNPPYLPQDKYDKKKDTTGGKQGYEIIVKFLKNAKEHLNKKGKILLLFSSLSKPEIIKKQAEELDYKTKLLNKKRFFFEELFVYELES